MTYSFLMYTIRVPKLDKNVQLLKEPKRYSQPTYCESSSTSFKFPLISVTRISMVFQNFMQCILKVKQGAYLKSDVYDSVIPILSRDLKETWSSIGAMLYNSNWGDPICSKTKHLYESDYIYCSLPYDYCRLGGLHVFSLAVTERFLGFIYFSWKVKICKWQRIAGKLSHIGIAESCLRLSYGL